MIAQACAALTGSNVERAKQVIRTQYPFTPVMQSSRKYSEFQSLAIFWRDGFVDRYSGVRLVFPGTLRLLSQMLPEEFPAHPNWKMAESHFAFWELFPTVDHLHPVARGGADETDNWLTTSMLRNSAKSNWTLEELGWELHAPGDPVEWDGLTRWFLEMTNRDGALLSNPYLRRWHSAASRLLADR